jgi:hypothetical protein
MTPAPTREPLWEVAQVAEYLRIPVETLYAWRKRDYGPPAGRVGRHLRYEPGAVRQWFYDQQRAA